MYSGWLVKWIIGSAYVRRNNSIRLIQIVDDNWRCCSFNGSSGLLTYTWFACMSHAALLASFVCCTELCDKISEQWMRLIQEQCADWHRHFSIGAPCTPYAGASVSIAATAGCRRREEEERLGGGEQKWLVCTLFAFTYQTLTNILASDVLFTLFKWSTFD